MTKTWRQASLEVIADQYTSIKQTQPQLSDREILKMISRDYYPFGERAYYPYKAWLLAMKQVKRDLGIITNSKKPPMELPLFDKNVGT